MNDIRVLPATLGRMLNGPLGRNAIGTFGLRVLRSGLGFAISALLARLLGPDAFGAYSVALTTGWILAAVAAAGTQHLLIREIAVCRARQRWELLQGVLRWTNRVVLLAALALCALAAGIVAMFHNEIDPLIVAAFWPALLMVPIASQIARRQGAMQGLDRLVAGQIPELLVQPSLMLLLIALVYTLPVVGLSASLAVGLRVAVAGLALLLGYRMLQRALPKAAATGSRCYKAREWIRSCAGFLVLSVTFMLGAQAPIVVLGLMRGPGEAGVFAITFAIAELLSFASAAVSAALAPRVAGHYALAAHGPLQALLVKGARAALLAIAPIAAFLIAFAGPVLGLLGEGYSTGAAALIILMCAHVIAALIGLPGLLLVMTRHEALAARCNGLATAMNLALCLVLIPPHGVNGAAIATAAGFLTRQLLLALAARGRLPVRFAPWTSVKPDQPETTR